MALTLLFPFFKLLTYVPVAHWTVTFFSWNNWLSGYSYGDSFNTKGWWEEVPISKVSELIIHFHPVFSRCPVSHLSGPLHPHAGISQRGRLPWRWTFWLQRRYNFSLVASDLFSRKLFQAEDLRVRRTVWNLPSCQDARWQDNAKTFAEVANENAVLRIAENFPSW